MLLNQNVLRVADPDAARVLTNTREWALLSVFMDEASLSGAAEKLGMSLPALSYRVKKLLELGLLQISRVEKRKGSPVKYYRTVAEHFFVPFRVTPSATLENLLASSNERFDKRMRHEWVRVFLAEEGDWGLNLYRGEGGGLNYTFSPIPERDETFVMRSLQATFPAVYDSLFSINLDFDTAKALQHDLHELVQRYLEMEKLGQQTYLLRLNLVPLVPQ